MSTTKRESKQMHNFLSCEMMPHRSLSFFTIIVAHTVCIFLIKSLSTDLHKRHPFSIEWKDLWVHATRQCNNIEEQAQYTFVRVLQYQLCATSIYTQQERKSIWSQYQPSPHNLSHENGIVEEQYKHHAAYWLKNLS